MCSRTHRQARQEHQAHQSKRRGSSTPHAPPRRTPRPRRPHDRPPSPRNHLRKTHSTQNRPALLRGGFLRAARARRPMPASPQRHDNQLPHPRRRQTQPSKQMVALRAQAPTQNRHLPQSPPPNPRNPCPIPSSNPRPIPCTIQAQNPSKTAGLPDAHPPIVSLCSPLSPLCVRDP